MAARSVIQRARRAAAEGGIRGALAAALRASRYHLVDKWQFAYFAFAVDDPFPSFPRPSDLVVRVATAADRPRIVDDLFMELVGPQAYDRRYFDEIDTDANRRCYLAESNGRLVHYSWVTLDARRSVLAELPVGALSEGDVYIGPVFTSPRARGFVYPFVLGDVIGDLRAAGKRRLLLMVDGRRLASLAFYRRLNFAPTGRLPGSPFRLPRARRRMP